MKKNAYIAAPFESKSIDQGDKYYGIIKDTPYIDFLMKIEDILKSNGWETVLPHRLSDWGRNYLDPIGTTEQCLKHLQDAELILAYPQYSRGVHLEIGYAAALRKQIIFILDSEETESAMVAGLGSVTNVEIIRLENPHELEMKLNVVLKTLHSEE
jgi:nucleoside 2-deoxyribosyltransferase